MDTSELSVVVPNAIWVSERPVWFGGEGLPEPVAKAIEMVVRTFKVQLIPPAGRDTAKPKATAGELPRWPGNVVDSIRREDIYADVG